MASRQSSPRARTWHNQRIWQQYTLLAGSSPIRQGRYKSRKGWPRPGAFGKQGAVAVSPLLWRCPQVTAVLDFEGDGRMMIDDDDYGPMWRHVLSHNSGGISHFRRAETSTNTPQLKQVFYVTCLYAAAGTSRYRLINVTPRHVITYILAITHLCVLQLCNVVAILVSSKYRSYL